MSGRFLSAGVGLLLALPVQAAPSSLPPAQAEAASRRAQRRLFALGEFGWNSLSGVGVVGGYHLHPNLTVEAGAGFSPVKWKLGGRVRANLWTADLTPFAAAGFTYGFGDPDEEVVFLGGPPLRYRVLQTPAFQLTGGVDFSGEDDVVFLVSAGWSFLLRENLEITRGIPSAQQRQILDLAFRSGPVISVAFGYAF